MTQSPKVLCLVSKGRSGSTLLDNAIGQLQGFHSTGELGLIWEHGLLKDGACGCRRPVRECPFWDAVFRKMFPDQVMPITEIAGWRNATSSWSAVPRMLRGVAWDALERYTTLLSRLCRAIADVSGSRVVVDSTKLPSPTPFGLVPGIESYVVHLVRDPRAVAHSWSRWKRWEPSGAEMPRWGPTHSTLSWYAHNLTTETVRRRRGRRRSTLVRHEDFVRDPGTELERIRRLPEAETSQPLPVRDGRTIILGVSRTAFGNPSRFRAGAIELREDDEWVTRADRLRNLLTTGFALPMLRRYGYPVTRPGGSRDGDHGPPGAST